MSPVRGEFKQTSKLRKCGSRQDDRMSTGERAETGEVSMLLAANSDVQPGVQRWQDGDFLEKLEVLADIVKQSKRNRQVYH